MNDRGHTQEAIAMRNASEAHATLEQLAERIRPHLPEPWVAVVLLKTDATWNLLIVRQLAWNDPTIADTPSELPGIHELAEPYAADGIRMEKNLAGVVFTSA